MKTTFNLFVALLVVPALVHAQGDVSQATVTVTKVAGSVSMLVGAGGNIGLSVGEDGIVMVDDQYAPLAPKIEAAIRQVSDKPLRFILNTHYHGDHTGGNATFGRQAPVVAQTNVRKRLASGTTLFGKANPPAAKEALPIVTFDDKLSLHFNGEEIRAVHFPRGHTDGDLVIFFTGSNVVHMGDNFFNGTFPFIDIDNGGSALGMLANDEKIYAMLSEEVKIIPGHGPLATKEDLRKFITMLRETTSAVRAGIKKGKSLDDLKAARVLQKYDAWGKGFMKTDQFLGILFKELSLKKK